MHAHYSWLYKASKEMTQILKFLVPTTPSLASGSSLFLFADHYGHHLLLQGHLWPSYHGCCKTHRAHEVQHCQADRGAASDVRKTGFCKILIMYATVITVN